LFKQPEDTGTRVVFNTGILYIKMFFTIAASLYTVRLLLDALGTSDYGIYTLIAGVISLLSFLNGAMTVSTQRYLSFHQGTGDVQMQRKVFNNSWILHVGIGLLVSVGLLITMPFLFNGFLNIDADRISIAKDLYYFVLISLFFTIISVPFTASLNAHENMLWSAIVLILQSFLKLLIAISLYNFVETDRLFYYGLLMAGVSVISFLLYAIFCLKKYKECSITQFEIDKPLIKELGSFAGWNLYTNLCYVLNTQGSNIIFNLFFGTRVNAAYGIAFQVNGQMKNLSRSLLQALNPQIMISEGLNDRQRTIRISMLASKFGFFLMAIFAIPCIFEMPALLKIWLKDVPEYTTIFSSYFLIATLINQLTVGISPAIQAIGRIRNFQLIIGSVALINLPIAYFLLTIGQPASSVLVIIVLIEIITGILKIVLFERNCEISFTEYFKSVVMKMILPTIINCMLIYVATTLVFSSLQIIPAFTISFVCFPVLFYLLGFNKIEKGLIITLIKKIWQRLNI
jgi:Na+-driven multidrug efflux pump